MKRFAWLSAAVLGLGMATLAQAQSEPWPNRPVKIIVAFTAGGTSDIMARTVGARLADKLKQTRSPTSCRSRRSRTCRTSSSCIRAPV